MEELPLAHCGRRSWGSRCLPVHDFVQNTEPRGLDPPLLNFSLLALLLAFPLPPTKEFRALPWWCEATGMWHSDPWQLVSPVDLAQETGAIQGRENDCSLALGWDGGNGNTGQGDP